MILGELLLNFVPIALIGGLAYFVYKSNRQQRFAVLLAWAFPGAGHWWLGHRARAKYFAAFLVPMFLVGMILAGFLNISPFDRHPIWGLAQLPGGLLTLVGWLATTGLEQTTKNDFYYIGCLYSGSACLLNLLAMCDVWDLAESPEQRAAAVAQTGKKPSEATAETTS
ncbi:MAG: hypothetical protein CL910_16515 [Deltaproteobacteria bacterium]|nr:hypothetical protein [Deltaproteobacteria bacterium]